MNYTFEERITRPRPAWHETPAGQRKLIERQLSRMCCGDDAVINGVYVTCLQRNIRFTFVVANQRVNGKDAVIDAIQENER